MPFQLISPEHHQIINKLVDTLTGVEPADLAENLARLIDRIKNHIPEKRRISTGRYSIVKALGIELYPLLVQSGITALDFASGLFDQPGSDPFVRSLAVQLICLSGSASGSLEAIKPQLQQAAADQDWIVRECSSGFIRRLIKELPEDIRSWYLELVQSEDPNLRRFVSESLRPVVENRWFHNQPEYALGIINHLFQEPAPYPRTSVGNSLSDWLRVDREFTWPLVTTLATSGDPNSYWIAYRACRNLVKKEPLLVLDLLGVEEYKYKNRVYRRADPQLE